MRYVLSVRYIDVFWKVMHHVTLQRLITWGAQCIRYSLLLPHELLLLCTTSYNDATDGATSMRDQEEQPTPPGEEQPTPAGEEQPTPAREEQLTLAKSSSSVPSNDRHRPGADDVNRQDLGIIVIIMLDLRCDCFVFSSNRTIQSRFQCPECATVELL